MGSTVAAIAGPVLGLAGGLISGSKASNAQNAAAQTARENAATAARMAQFRPVGTSTRFGTSTFSSGPEGLTSAGYTLSPELKSLQDYVMSQAGLGQQDTSRLLSLGRDYIAESPEDAAQEFMMSRRNLLQPGLEQQYGQIKSGLLRTGRGGLAIGQGGYLASANPELQAYYNAVARQEAELAAQADQEGFNRIVRGQGLLSSAYAPISTPVGLAGTFENLGQGALDISSGLGQQSAAAGGRAADLYSQGMATANQFQLARNSYSPFGTALSGAGSAISPSGSMGTWFSSLLNSGGGGGGAYGSMGGAPGMGSSMGTGLRSSGGGFGMSSGGSGVGLR
jgi:hypothetical protein